MSRVRWRVPVQQTVRVTLVSHLVIEAATAEEAGARAAQLVPPLDHREVLGPGAAVAPLDQRVLEAEIRLAADPAPASALPAGMAERRLSLDRRSPGGDRRIPPEPERIAGGGN